MESHVIKKIKKLEVIVEKFLLMQPETRDNDKLLILKVWAYQNPSIRQPEFSFLNFATSYLKGSYADSESITRARRKLQENNPNLRGEKWYERHEEAAKVRNEIVKY
jgi:hypothetical protein